MRTTVMRRWSARTLRSVRAVVGGDGGSCRTPVPFRVRLCGGGDRARARAPPAASWGWQRGLADSAFTPRDVGLLADELNERYSAGAEEGIVRTWLVTHIFKSYAKDRALRFLREERMTSRQLTNLIGQVSMPMPRVLCTVQHAVGLAAGTSCVLSKATLEPMVKADSAGCVA
jgi:hypothetical protein